MTNTTPDVHYLNHGSFGACPTPVFAEYQRLQRELEAEPVDFLDLHRSFPARMAAARVALADYLGAAADEIVFVPNATTGVNVVARSLALRPGDEVLSCDHEYGAMDRTWNFITRQNGAKYIHQPIPTPVTTHEEFVETFWSGVTENTKIIFLSHITTQTAISP